jgi:hypothetical protein
LKKGYCCQAKCKNCPYTNKAKWKNKLKKKIQ